MLFPAQETKVYHSNFRGTTLIGLKAITKTHS